MERNQTYINDLLKQYRDGSISDTDRHQLERIALDDPFLFDSLHGYSSMSKADWTRHLTNIKTKTTAPPGRIVRIRTMSLAAGFAILVAGLIWVNGQWNESSAEDFSQVSTEQVEEIEQSINSNENESVNTEDFVGIKPGDISGNAAPAGLLKEPTVTDNELTTIIPPSNIKPEELAKTDLVEVVDRNDEKDEKEKVAEKTRIAEVQIDPVASVSSSAPTPEVVETTVEESTDSNVGLARTSDSYSAERLKSKKRQVPELFKEESLRSNVEFLSKRTISGLVRDNTGEPLIGATILVPGSKIGASTEIDGSFALEVDSSINELQIAYVGYEDFVLSVDTRSSYDIMLDEGAVLDEVIVTGYASNVNEDNPSFVLPPGGRSDYKEVVKKMAQSGCNTSGKVRLKFTVNKYGEVTDFEVKKGLSEECNRRAIDIIKSSGRWDNQFNEDKKVRYTISF